MQIECTESSGDCGKHQSRDHLHDVIPTIGAWSPLTVQASNSVSIYTPEFRTNSGRIELRGAIVYGAESTLISSASFLVGQRPKRAFAIPLAHATNIDFPNLSGGIVNGSVSAQGGIHLGYTATVPTGNFIFLDGISWAY